MSKIITVFGATGNQGGSVIASIQGNPHLSSEYKVRGITRDPSKPAGQKLADKGVDLVRADLSDKESVKKAIEGSEVVFGVTNFWEYLSKDIEVTQGQNIANACKEVGVPLLIWSCSPSATKMSGGKLTHLPHFDSKAEVMDYIRAQKIPATFFHAGCFMNNILGAVQKGSEQNTLVWNLHPDTNMPLFDASADTGKFVAGIMLNRDKTMGKDVYGATGWYTPTEIANTIQEVSGKKTVFQEVPDEIFKRFLPEAVGQELMETFMLIKDFGYYGEGGREILEESLKVSQIFAEGLLCVGNGGG
ncbi:MAG: hypothetical protein Q9201_001297 [Fulgogasparrea decipioides]